MNPLRLILSHPDQPYGADSWDMVGEALPPFDAEAVSEEATRSALFQWQEARKRVAELEDNDPEKSESKRKWRNMAYDHFIEAERALIVAILGWDDRFTEHDVHDAFKRRYEPRGVVVEGVAYLAVPDPDRDECESDIDIMRLITVPMAGVVDLDRRD